MKYSILLLSILFVTNNILLSQIQHEVEGDTYINGKLGIKQNAVDASAILDIQSTTEGLLIPRMTSSQRLAIPNPAEGLMVYELSTNNFWFYDGSAWVEMVLSGGGGSSLWSQSGSDIFYNTGNVGVGIASPPGKFSVSDPNRNAITIKTGNNLLDNGIAFQNGGSAYSWNVFRSDAGNNDAHLIFAGGVSNSDINLLPERMRIRNNGNVGIGTNLPVTELHVAGNGALFRLEGSTHGFVEFYPEGPAVGRKAWLGYGSAATNDVFVINNQADGDMQLRTKSATRMTITNDGDVGIGATAPNQKVEVRGNLLVRNPTQNGAIILSPSSIGYGVNPELVIQSVEGSTGTNTGFVIARNTLFQTSDDTYRYISAGAAPAQRMLFGTDGSIHFGAAASGTGGAEATYANIMSILENGEVGIGTTNPDGYKLAVNGNMGAEEIEVRANYWADFVFDKNYKLLPLVEVEKYIQDNGHLPDVPSEEEAINQPLNLAEMDVLLLQKVEELTLYILEQEKLISAQQEALTKLEAKVKKMANER